LREFTFSRILVAVANNKPTDTVSQENVEMVATTVSLPEPLWKAVKMLAADRRVSAQSIWIEAIQQYLERQQQTNTAA
jgi:predicted DNA-binding ribbon-helix-helix protein